MTNALLEKIKNIYENWPQNEIHSKHSYFLPQLRALQEKIDYFEFGIRLTEDYKEYQVLVNRDDLFVTLHTSLYDEGVNLVVP